MSAPGRRLGLDPFSPVFLMENHDEAYHIWRQAEVQQGILVHLDAHDDLWWTEDQTSLNIANFISLALQEEIIGAVYWVVPDQTWESSRHLKAICRRLRKVLQSYPGNPGDLSCDPRRISASIGGRPLQVCTVDNLPRIEGRVLLDIDVDYLLIRRACHFSEPPQSLPWCWPEELLQRLDNRQLVFSLVTISYSVEGGYTPLAWKYLGDELALRLGSRQDDGKIRGLALMRAAALAAQREDFLSAGQDYFEARELLPGCAAPDYHLAQLYLAKGEPGQAAVYYRQALELDSSYRTAYNNSGPWYFAAGHLKQAEAAWRGILALDPRDAYALLGLGRLAAREKRWVEAEDWLGQALAIEPNLVDAHRTLGRVYARRGRTREAIAAYERSLILALRGYKPLHGHIATEYRGLADPDHFLIHGRLARLYELQGEAAKAINGYRLSIVQGQDRAFFHFRLARLYLKQRRWRLAAGESGAALRRVPRAVKVFLHKSLGVLHRAMYRG